jgi:hypothetical protein
MFGVVGFKPQSELPDTPPSPDEPIRFPLARRDIAQVWHANMWVWAVLRTPSRGRPRRQQNDLPGDWVDSTTFVPWAMHSGTLGLGVPLRFPNDLDDALRASALFAGKPLKRLSFAQLIGFRPRRGRLRVWTAEKQARLLSLVLDQATLDGTIPERVFRNPALRKAFGNRSACAIRRQFFTAWAALKSNLATNQIGDDFPA